VALILATVSPTAPRAKVFARTAGLSLVVGIALAWSLRVSSSAPLVAIELAQLAVVLIILLVLRVNTGGIDLFNPFVLVLFEFLLLYTLQAHLMTTGGEQFSKTFAPEMLAGRDLQVRAAVCASLALLSVTTGYFSGGLGRKTRSPDVGRVWGPRGARPENGDFRTRRGVVIVGGLALFATLIVTVGGPTSLVHNLYNRTTFFQGKNYFAYGPVVMFAGAAARLMSEEAWPPRRSTGLLLGLSFGLSFLTGAKANVAIEAILLAGIYHYSVRRLRAPMVAALCVVLVFSSVALDIYLRNALPRHVSIGQAVSEAGGPQRLVTTLFASDTFFGEQAMALAVTSFPSAHRYLGVDAFTPVLLAPVPRSVYAGKPLPTAAIFTQQFAPSFYDAGSTVPATAFGEMYIAFGYVGIILGGLALGYVLRRVYDARYRSTRHLFVCVATSALVLHYLRGEFFGVVIPGLIVGVPGLWALDQSKPRRER